MTGRQKKVKFHPRLFFLILFFSRFITQEETMCEDVTLRLWQLLPFPIREDVSSDLSSTHVSRKQLITKLMTKDDKRMLHIRIFFRFFDPSWVFYNAFRHKEVIIYRCVFIDETKCNEWLSFASRFTLQIILIYTEFISLKDMTRLIKGIIRVIYNIMQN